MISIRFGRPKPEDGDRCVANRAFHRLILPGCKPVLGRTVTVTFAYTVVF